MSYESKRSYEFNRLAAVPAVEELTDQDHLLAEVGGEVVRAPRGEAGGGAFVVDLMGMEVLKVSSNGDNFTLKAPDEATFSGLRKAVLDGRPICLRNFGEFFDTNTPAPVALAEAETANEEASESGLVADNFFVTRSLTGTTKSGGALVEGVELFLGNLAAKIFPADYVDPGPV